MSFDPYHQWLGIPPQEQPPHYYRLLGIQLFETEPSVIDHAADRQMAHLRSFQQGPRGDLAAMLLNAVSAARVCLLDREKKAAYDAQLSVHLSSVNPMMASGSPDLPPMAVAEPELPPMAVAGPELPPMAIDSSPPRIASNSMGPQSNRPLATVTPSVRPPVARPPSARPPSDRSASAAPQSPQPQSARPQSARRRPGKNPAVEIVKVVVGGIAGVIVAVLIGGFVFGVGPLGGMKSKDTQEVSETPEPNNGNDAKKSNSNPIQPRVISRTQPSKQRFGDSTSPASAVDKGSSVDSADSDPAALAKLLDQPFAEVVPLLGGEFLPLQVNVSATTSPRYFWSRVAPELKGFYFLQNEYQQRTTDFEITKSGMVLLAVNAHWGGGGPSEGRKETAIRQGLEKDSWREVGDLDVQDKDNLGNIKPFILFARECKQGESFSYRTERDMAPLLVLKPNSSMLANRSDTGEKTGGSIARPAKHPIPDEATEQASLATIREIFKQEYAAAADRQQTPEQLAVAQLKLAKALEERAEAVQDEFAARYVLLNEAYNQSLAAGNVPRSQQLAYQLIAEYEVDELEMGQDFLTKLAETEQSDRVKVDLANASITLANQFLDAERFDEALRVADLAQSFGERSARLKARVQECSDEIREAQQQWNAIRKAKATLAGNPDDADANLLYGTHLCVEKGDWPSGLPLLCKGSDQQLQTIAEADLEAVENRANENEQIIALADRWYELANSNTSYKPFFTRAYYWYAVALPEAKALAKIKSEKRIEELAEYDPAKAIGQGTADSSGAPTPIAATMRRLSRKGSSYARIQLAVAAEFVPLEIDSAVTADANSSRWSNIPQELIAEKLAFLRSKEQQSTLKFEITSSGMVLMTALWNDIGKGGSWEKEASTQQDLASDGWIEVGKLEATNKLTGESEDWVLFARFCKKGETFSHRTNISTAPVLILK